jgi:hypothetical protein
LQILIHMASFPPGCSIGKALPRGGAQPHLPPNAGSGHHTQLLWGTVRVHPNSRHIDNIDLCRFCGEELEVSGWGTIPQQQDLPGGSQLGMRQPSLHDRYIALPKGLEHMPCRGQQRALS